MKASEINNGDFFKLPDSNTVLKCVFHTHVLSISNVEELNFMYVMLMDQYKQPHIFSGDTELVVIPSLIYKFADPQYSKN